ncbi:MAG TPA: molecular chaperone TorD family protein [Dehalococcoidia bacterium]|nr:molecular chaperone TorD family protein [Dehalococcoidia bacterium]
MMAPTATTLDVQARPVQRALGRSAIYRLLSLACAYPTDDRIRVLREEALPPALIGAEALGRGLKARLDALASLLPSLELEKVRDHYHRTFGHVSVPDCPAYESAYMGTNLFQHVHRMADVAGFYRAFGFTVSDAHRERVDHLTMELEFMHVLTFKEAYALVHHGRDKVSVCRRAQRKFWREHLGRWLPAFVQLLAAKAAGGFYGELAQVLSACVQAEAKVLGDAPQLGPSKPDAQAPADSLECPWTDEGCPMVPS